MTPVYERAISQTFNQEKKKKGFMRRVLGGVWNNNGGAFKVTRTAERGKYDKQERSLIITDHY